MHQNYGFFAEKIFSKKPRKILFQAILSKLLNLVVFYSFKTYINKRFNKNVKSQENQKTVFSKNRHFFNANFFKK